jgi:hypothetical protein
LIFLINNDLEVAPDAIGPLEERAGHQHEPSAERELSHDARE